MQEWTFSDIEAETAEEAKQIADSMAVDEPYPQDDYSYETTAKEQE